jgi:glycosyltransferase involved in cell wall biosynthesis
MSSNLLQMPENRSYAAENSFRKVLFVAYNFPPHGGAGVQRSTKFVKYLPDFGWNPLVITAEADAALIMDRTLQRDIPPKTQLYRLPGFSMAKLHRQLAKYRLSRGAVALNILLQLPDADRFWSLSSRAKVAQVIRDAKPDLLYTTSGPYSSHLLGKWVRDRFRIPWLADFRDPWSENLLVPYLPGYRRLNRIMERQVLERADRVVCVTSRWLDGLRSNCRECLDEKFITISNGYDDEDIRATPLPAGNARFVLTHIGSFYRTRQPDHFIAAVDRLISAGRLNEAETQLRFVGKNARAQIPRRTPFEIVDYVPHKQLEAVRAETDALLLILSTDPRNAGTPSGKIYEYIASNRPILAIVPKGGVAEELIKETRTGITVEGNVESIANGLEQLYGQWQAGFPQWSPNWDAIRQYTRRNLTAKLAAEFDKLVAGFA